MRSSRIYILPTKFGLSFLSGAIFMILIGASYQNNLVNLLAFFMLSIVFIAMIQTHNNLKDVRIHQVDSEGCFAGGEFMVSVVLGNEAKEPRFNIETALRKLEPTMQYENVHPLLARSTLKLRSAYPAAKRGCLKLNDVKLSTTYPLGLFRAWIWLPASAEVLIYPQPKGQTALPYSGGKNEEAELARQSSQSGVEDFRGHRKYQTGDSHRHIDWKAWARGRPMMTKEFDADAADGALFDWQQLSTAPEERLSQLALWVDEARKRRIPFSLKLPGQSIGPGLGTQHATRCLEALARFNPDESSGGAA